MGPKKMSAKGSSEKKRRMMSMKLKQEIIEKHERGMRVSDLAKEYDRSTSTICTILKQKELLKVIMPAKGIKIISKLRTSAHEEMERLLLVWLMEKQLAGDTVTESIICEKAREIYGGLVERTPGTSVDEASQESFKASRGWFDNFKKRSGIHSVLRHGHSEAASTDKKSAKAFIETFAKLVEDEAYIPQQVFNCDEAGLFWKKMPRRTYITTEEKNMPAHKPTKNRLALGLCANVSGDYKIKHSEELTTEELKELQQQQHSEVLQEISGEEPEVDEVISTSEIKEMLRIWEKIKQFIEKTHPEKVAASRALELCNDTCFTHYRNVLKGRKKKISMERFLLKQPLSKIEESVAKHPKIKEENDK